MARRMVGAGFPVVLWARRPETLAPFHDTPARYADSIADLARQSDHVGVCVVDDAGVIAVCDTLIATMAPGGRIVIHSTVLPSTCRTLAANAERRGLALLDAPVSGGGPAAQTGALTVMVGGEAAVLDAARPVFESFAKLIVHLGDVGAGQNAKLVNNALMAANMAVAFNALSAGDALGIDRSALTQLLSASSGRSYGLEIVGRLPTPSAFAHGAVLLAKDTRLLCETLGETGPALALSLTARPFLDLVQGNGSAPSS